MGVFILSGACAIKAGKNVSTSIPDRNGWVTWISGAEAFINTTTRYNWSDNYSSLNADVKHVLTDVGESIVAMQAINYDMSGYTSRAEAQTMLDFLRDRINEGIKYLQDKLYSDYIKGA